MGPVKSVSTPGADAAFRVSLINRFASKVEPKIALYEASPKR